ncbi:MAG TPA: type II secretion system protein GspM [Steroidobacteraceae bacterium]|nr:type II secretion system protein GspM [Steroidobacteraceae bacterium]
MPRSLDALSARERRVVMVGAGLAALLLVLAVVLPMQLKVSELDQRVAHKQDDLAWLRSMAPQLAGLQASQPRALRESLVVVVDRTARQSGLEHALVGSQPSGDGGLNVRFEQTSFDGLIAWLSQLHELYGIRVDAAEFDAAGTIGTVNASLVLRAR